MYLSTFLTICVYILPFQGYKLWTAHKTFLKTTLKYNKSKEYKNP